jgi:hypothetical protein
MKICEVCKQNKYLTDFYKSISSKDGYEYRCKQCKNIYCKKRHNINKENINNYHKIYYINNKEEHLLRTNNWKNNNKEKHQKYLNEYTSKYYHNNPQYKLRRLLRDRIYKVVSNKNVTLKTKELLGCDFNKLKQYLEPQFKPEMNWDNHGRIWEIDHIKPCSSFDLTDIEQQKQCFHYTNLQPLFKTTEIAESFGYNEIGNRNKLNKII